MLAKKLKELRHKHGLTQDAAARLVHVTLRTWARYEAGERKPSATVLELFCLKLGEPWPDAVTPQCCDPLSSGCGNQSEVEPPYSDPVCRDCWGRLNDCWQCGAAIEQQDELGSITHCANCAPQSGPDD